MMNRIFDHVFLDHIPDEQDWSFIYHDGVYSNKFQAPYYSEQRPDLLNYSTNNNSLCYYGAPAESQPSVFDQNGFGSSQEITFKSKLEPTNYHPIQQTSDFEQTNYQQTNYQQTSSQTNVFGSQENQPITFEPTTFESTTFESTTTVPSGFESQIEQVIFESSQGEQISQGEPISQGEHFEPMSVESQVEQTVEDSTDEGPPPMKKSRFGRLVKMRYTFSEIDKGEESVVQSDEEYVNRSIITVEASHSGQKRRGRPKLNRVGLCCSQCGQENTPQWRYLNRYEAATTKCPKFTFPYIDLKLLTLDKDDDLEWVKEVNPDLSPLVAERLKRVGPLARIVMCNSCWLVVRKSKQKR